MLPCGPNTRSYRSAQMRKALQTLITHLLNERVAYHAGCLRLKQTRCNLLTETDQVVDEGTNIGPFTADHSESYFLLQVIISFQGQRGNVYGSWLSLYFQTLSSCKVKPFSLHLKYNEGKVWSYSSCHIKAAVQQVSLDL